MFVKESDLWCARAARHFTHPSNKTDQQKKTTYYVLDPIEKLIRDTYNSRDR